MRPLLILTLLAALMGACAAPAGPMVTAATERSVMVDMQHASINASQAEALPVAQAHCQKHGRHARFTGYAGPFLMSFDCVQ